MPNYGSGDTKHIHVYKFITMYGFLLYVSCKTIDKHIRKTAQLFIYATT